MSRNRRTFAVALLAALLAAPALPAAAAVPTCHGQPATITGSRGAAVRGTEGPDVIVANRASEIAALGGDDLICSASTDDGSDLMIDAGGGDDVVDTAGNVGISSYVVLGGGDDTYTGGDEVDFLYQSPDLPDPAAGTDTVTTGGGDDMVVTGGDRTTPDADVVDLGPGADVVDVVGSLQGARWDGGAGTDQVVWERFPRAGAYVVDNARGRVTRDGAETASWSSFSRFDFFAGGARDLRFVGGDGPESVRSLVQLDDVRLGGGDDVLQLSPENLARASAMRLSGESGDDLLRAGADYTSGEVDLRLGAGSVRFVRPGRAGATSVVRGFDRAEVVASWAHVVGTSRPDRIRWNACRGEVLGAGGGDTVRYLPLLEVTCGSGGRVTVHGGPGPDVLVGGRLGDRLVGGTGRDRADGRGGRDYCRAETKVRCEL